jgi:hypothetical protein
MTLRNKLLLAAALTGAFLIGHHAHAETKVCRGIVMANWTNFVADLTPVLDSSRLIVPIGEGSINDACLFDVTMRSGQKIMTVCKMGRPCEAKVVLANSIDHPADVNLVGRVLSVRGPRG